MKKLSITIALIIASFFTANAIVLENKRIIFQDNCIWDEDSDKSVTPIKKVNSYLQNSLLLGSQVQTHKEQTPWDIVDDIYGLDWYIYRTGYELLPGAFYKVLPTKCDIHGSTFHHRR